MTCSVSPLLQRLRVVQVPVSQTLRERECLPEGGLGPKAQHETPAQALGVASPLLQQLQAASRIRHAITSQQPRHFEDPTPRHEELATNTGDSIDNVSNSGVSSRSSSSIPLLQRLVAGVHMQSLHSKQEPSQSASSPLLQHRAHSAERLLAEQRNSLPPPSEEEEAYDPRKPEFVRAATAEESAAMTGALLKGQIAHLSVALQTRQQQQFGSDEVLNHYQHVLRNLQAEACSISCIGFSLRSLQSTHCNAATLPRGGGTCAVRRKRYRISSIGASRKARRTSSQWWSGPCRQQCMVFAAHLDANVVLTVR